MRTVPLKNNLEANNVTFGDRFGIEIPLLTHDNDKEYGYIRDSVGITDFSFMQKYVIPEETALDFLDGLVAGNVAKTRFGRVLHTFLANDDGQIVADCFIANNDEEYVLLCESIVDDATLQQILDSQGAAEAECKNVTDEQIVISIDGFKAWSVAKEVFGTDVLGLPYLSIEMYPFEDTEIHLFRAGKTSEFGYLIMAPKELGEKLFSTLLEAAKKHKGGLCGVAIHNDLRLEGRFFNIFAEGMHVKDPLSLGLQWMIDFDKDSYIGQEAIQKRREEGLTKKIIGVSALGDCDSFTEGAHIMYEGKSVATVEAVCYSPILNRKIGLALFSVDLAYAGLTFTVEGSDDQVTTISMPPIMPKSLSVKLDEL